MASIKIEIQRDLDNLDSYDDEYYVLLGDKAAHFTQLAVVRSIMAYHKCHRIEGEDYSTSSEVNTYNQDVDTEVYTCSNGESLILVTTRTYRETRLSDITDSGLGYDPAEARGLTEEGEYQIAKELGLWAPDDGIIENFVLFEDEDAPF